MSIVFLNGEYLPIEQAKISPLDRGFLFGDGIYELLPSYQGKMVGCQLHIARMQSGLQAVGIDLNWSDGQWLDLCHTLIECNGGGNLAIYLHVSRGAYSSRHHEFPQSSKPTVFSYTFSIPSAPVADKKRVETYKVSTAEDLRWQRCHIKSTSLIGNVLHYQQGAMQGLNETLLYNADNQLTEGSTSNVYIVKEGCLITPPLDDQILPGITRHILLDILRKDGRLPVKEHPISMNEVINADEVWVTGSVRGIIPVVEIDGIPVGDGGVGDQWLAAQTLYDAKKFNY